MMEDGEDMAHETEGTTHMKAGKLGRVWCIQEALWSLPQKGTEYMLGSRS